VGHPERGAPGVTRRFSQIVARSRRKHEARSATAIPKPEPGQRPRPKGGKAAAPQSLSQRAGGPKAVAPTVGTSFLGAQISDTVGYVPPDSMGSVGPSQIVVAVNGRLKVFNKSGTVQFSVDDETFWSSVRNGTGVSDPEVEYDRLSGRWIIAAINVAATNNRIMLAVSSGPTITDQTSFTFFQFANGLSSGTLFADYPQMGVDKNAVYIGTNNFDSSDNFVNTSGFVIRKSDLLSGTLTVTTFPALAAGTGSGPYTPQGVTDQDPAATEGYFIGVDNQDFSKLDVRRVSNPGGTPTISGDLTISVPPTYFPLSVPAFGSVNNLDAIDDRLMEAMIARDPATGTLHLWTAHNLRVNSSGVASSSGDRDGLRWYEIGSLSGTPALVQSGTVFDSAVNSAFYWIPSIAANGEGQAVIASSIAGATRFAGIAAAQRFPGDAAGTMSAPTVVQDSSSAYNAQITSPQRWGDYSQTVVDPTDNMTFWTFQEYANAMDSWGVRVIQIKAPPPATPSATSPVPVPQGQASTSAQITGTSSGGSGFFDPGSDPGGPGFVNHIQASVSGGVTVNSVSFTDATHVTLDLDTRAATIGAKDVTITNPDGQSRTGPGVLTIGSDTTPPDPPTLTATDPASPANDNNPKLKGTAEAGSTMKLYATSDCSGSPVATGSAADFTSPGIAVSVADNSTTTFHATATDAVSNASACSSSSITYVEDSTPPNTTITKHPRKRTTSRKARFALKSSQARSTFKCKLDAKPFKPCSSRKAYRNLKPGKHTFRAKATDAAGNTDRTPARYGWKVLR